MATRTPTVDDLDGTELADLANAAGDEFPDVDEYGDRITPSGIAFSDRRPKVRKVVWKRTRRGGTCSGTTVARSSDREMRCSRPATAVRTIHFTTGGRLDREFCSGHADELRDD